MIDFAHRVIHRTAHGATETLRVYGGPDRDMVAMHIADLFNSRVLSVEPVDRETPRIHGEMDFEANFADPLPARA